MTTSAKRVGDRETELDAKCKVGAFSVEGGLRQAGV